MSGALAVGRPKQVAAEPQVPISPTQLNIHGLMVSMDARHTGGHGFYFLLRHFVKNSNHRLALPGPLVVKQFAITSLRPQNRWTICEVDNSWGGQSFGWSIRWVDNPLGGQSGGWTIRGGQTVGGENNHEYRYV